MMSFIPWYYLESVIMNELMDASGIEFDNVRDAIDDILNQFFVATATWGLDRWEEFLGIATDTSKTIDARRQAIIQKINGNSTVTLDFLTTLVNMYVADGQAFIIDHPETYSIDILHHGGQVLDYTALEKDINTYIPAHIGHTLCTYTKGTAQIYSAGIARRTYTMRVGMTLQPENRVAQTTLYAAGTVIHQVQAMRIFKGG